jgi:hypothetical protein
LNHGKEVGGELVVAPRDRPRQWSASPFLSSRPAGGRERRCCRSSECRHREQRQWHPSACSTHRPSAIARSGCSRWCAGHSPRGDRAKARRIVAPRRCPFRTRRSSTRGTPRGLFGSSGSITRHSKSVRSYRLILILNQNLARYGSGLSANAESARGISPRAAHRSGLDTLASSGSCHRMKAAAFH